MEIIKRLNFFQKTILLIIVGVVAFIALEGLSHYRRDYYVSAALAKAFFSGVLLLVISSPILYLVDNNSIIMRNNDLRHKLIDRLKLFIVALAILVFLILLIVLIGFISDGKFPN